MAILTRDQIYTVNNRPIFLQHIQELRPAKADAPAPIFTIRDEKEGLISLKKLYMSFVVDDPTESVFAEEVFGDLGYWLIAREMGPFKPVHQEWIREADILRKQIAFKAIMSEAKEGGRSAFSAAKFLIDEPWKGRKAKAESKKTTEEAFAAVKNEYSEDYHRLKEQGLIQ